MNTIRFLLALLSIGLGLGLLTWTSPASGQDSLATPTATSPTDVEPTPGQPTAAPTAAPQQPTATPVPRLTWNQVPETGQAIAAGGQIHLNLFLQAEQARLKDIRVTAVSDKETMSVSCAPASIGALLAGQTAAVTLTVKASSAQAVGEEAIVTLVADDGQGHAAHTTITVRVTWAHVVSVEITPHEQMVDPDTIVAAQGIVTNRDELAHQVNLKPYVDQEVTFDYDAGEPSQITLQPGQTHEFRFLFHPLLGATPGMRGHVVMEAHVPEVDQVTAAEAFAIVSARYGVSAAAAPRQQQPAWGENAAYSLRITNSGSLAGPIQVEILSGADHYPATLQAPPSSEPLAPGQSTQLQLQVEPVFAGASAFLSQVTERFHRLTPDDKQFFANLLRDHDDTIITVRLGEAVTDITVTTLRPQRPKINSARSANTTSPPTPGASPHSRSGLACGACHEPHGSPMVDAPGRPSALLIASNVRATCLTCHDGTGSPYNVQAGLIGSSLPSPAGPLHLPGEAKSAIVGQRFQHATYQQGGGLTDYVPANPSTRPITSMGEATASSHLLERRGTPPGSQGSADWLTCTTCHDPHGSSNARLFRSSITFGQSEPHPVVFDITYTDFPPQARDTLSACQACHTAFDNHGSSQPRALTDEPSTGKTRTTWQARSPGLTMQSAPDSPALYVVCLTCHHAHGSHAAPDFPNQRPELVDVARTLGSWCAACHDL